MKQYYEDGSLTLPFAHIEAILHQGDTTFIYIAGKELFTLHNAACLVEEYRAWLDAENENARN